MQRSARFTILPHHLRSDVWLRQATESGRSIDHPQEQQQRWSALLDVCKHLLDEGDGRVAIAGRVTRPLCDIQNLDHAVVDVHGEALAARVAKEAGRWLDGELECLGEFAAGVTHEGEHGAFALLILRPGLHHCAVIHRHDDDFVHTLPPQRVLTREVAWNRLGGAGGREGSWKSHHDHLLSCAALGHGHCLRWEAEVQGHVGDLVAHACERTRRKHRPRRRAGCNCHANASGKHGCRLSKLQKGDE
mmetsp:Transcript_55875/g.90393  ORF Transcript_55875/g.90393 Transcript_55875/m.90393 type:complete len:247 (+) Transcript_55875:126-866(+)